MRQSRLSSLVYFGQSTEELLASCAGYHPKSVLAAFDAALQAKATKMGRRSLSREEVLLLAVMALDRSMHSGGFAAYRASTGPRTLGIIVRSLLRIGCIETSTVVEKALNGADFDECNREYYQLRELAPRLLIFVRDHASEFQLAE